MVATVHPWVGKCSVLESPIDTCEEERPSGLLVEYEQQGWSELKRGIIIEIAEGSNFLAPGIDALNTQDVIYYQSGFRIGEVIIVSLGDIIAYERADGS
jgi:hypothetical protein